MEDSQTNALDSLLANLELNPTQDSDEPAADDTTTDAAEPNATDSAQPETDETNTDPAGEGATEAAKEAPPADKTNKAFAQMRVQNKSYQEAMAGLLTKLGVDPALAKDPAQVQALLDNAATAEQAKELNVPTELLQRLTHLERTNQRQEQERIANIALQGFKAVQDKYGLSEKELAEFATQLQAANTNPFEKEMDLDLAYRVHNQDKIVAKEVQKAVQAALAKQQTAATRSTAPPKSNGKPDTSSTGETEINTMAQFDQLLRKI